MAFNTDQVQTLHRYAVLWVDKYIGVPSNNEIMKNRFRRIADPFEIFTDANVAIDFVYEQEKAGKSVFIIVSDTLANDIVPKVLRCECVVKLFLFCDTEKDHTVCSGFSINKWMIIDSDEELLIRLTNEIAKHLTEEANKHRELGQKDIAIGLLNWVDWLYEDADTFQRDVCQKIRADIRRQLQQLQ